jgi:hypothetical protein
MTDMFDNSKRAINVSYKNVAALKKIIGKDEFADLQNCISKAMGYLPYGKNNPCHGDAYFIQSIENKFQAPFEQLVKLADPGNPLKEVLALARLGLESCSGFSYMSQSEIKRLKAYIEIVENSITN